MDITAVFTPDKMPVRSQDLIRVIRQKWPHLRDVHSALVPGVPLNLLIRCDILEVHRVLGQRLGNQKKSLGVGKN